MSDGAEASMAAEERLTLGDLSDEEQALVLKARGAREKFASANAFAGALTTLVEEYPQFKDDVQVFLEKKALKKDGRGRPANRIATGWLVEHDDERLETVYCPNTEQARLYIAMNWSNGCPAGTTAGLERVAKTRGFTVTACNDPAVIEKYPKIDGLKRVVEGKKRTPFAVESK